MCWDDVEPEHASAHIYKCNQVMKMFLFMSGGSALLMPWYEDSFSSDIRLNFRSARWSGRHKVGGMSCLETELNYQDYILLPIALDKEILRAAKRSHSYNHCTIVAGLNANILVWIE